MSTGTRKSVSSTAKKSDTFGRAASNPTRKKTAPAKAAPTPAKRGQSMPARKIPAGVPAASSPAREVTLARVESVRLAQRTEGNFDCFARAGEGYCDQGGCAYHDECLAVSRLLHEM